MEYSNADLSVGQTDLSYVELPKICISVYKEIVKEMAEVIKDARIRDIFYSLSIGGDVSAVSRRTNISPRNLAYMYKKAGRQVRLEWKPILNGKRNWTVYISDAGIMRLCWHIPKRMLDRI